MSLESKLGKFLGTECSPIQGFIKIPFLMLIGVMMPDAALLLVGEVLDF
mgnify:CR=1 FL=1